MMRNKSVDMTPLKIRSHTDLLREKTLEHELPQIDPVDLSRVVIGKSFNTYVKGKKRRS